MKCWNVHIYDRDAFYGFINNDEGGKDVFVHISAVKEYGIGSLEEGDAVSFDIGENRGKDNATNLKKV